MSPQKTGRNDRAGNEKGYDVEDLTGANSAYFGFWGLAPITDRTMNFDFSRRIQMLSNSELLSPMSGLAIKAFF